MTKMFVLRTLKENALGTLQALKKPANHRQKASAIVQLMESQMKAI